MMNSPHSDCRYPSQQMEWNSFFHIFINLRLFSSLSLYVNIRHSTCYHSIFAFNSIRQIFTFEFGISFFFKSQIKNQTMNELLKSYPLNSFLKIINLIQFKKSTKSFSEKIRNKMRKFFFKMKK